MQRRQNEFERLSKYDCPESDTHNIPGVLLSDEIIYYANKYKMIDPFDEKCLKPAAYELRLGYEYAIGGEIKNLADETGKNTITIKPFQVVIIKTMEIINLPRFIIGRWNIRVRKAYEGLLWVGGPQVDPGYVGYLYCPIYNLSNKDVSLKLGEKMAVIDFVKTTPFGKGCIPYDRPPKRVLFEDYEPDKLKSALYTEAAERIGQIEEESERRNDKIEQRVSRVESFIALMFASIAILFAALSILVTTRSTQPASLSSEVFCWMVLSFAISILALLFSLRSIKINIHMKWQKLITFAFIVISIIGITYLIYSPIKKIMLWSIDILSKIFQNR